MGWFGRRQPAPGSVAYLNQYALGEGPVSLLDGPLDAAAPVPDWWRGLHSMPPGGRGAAALATWGPTVGLALPKTVAHLGEFTRDVQVMRLGPTYTLLYTLHNRRGPDQFYLGGNPLTSGLSGSTVEPYWRQLPEPLRAFYTATHDGFCHYESRALGIEPVSRLTPFTWIEQHPTYGALRFDPATTFSFFSDMVGDYVLIDLANPETGALIFWKDQPPTYGVDFFDVVDSWIVTGFEPL